MLRTALCERHIHSIASSRLCTAAAALPPNSCRKCSEQSVHWKKCSMNPLPAAPLYISQSLVTGWTCAIMWPGNLIRRYMHSIHLRDAMKKAPPEASGLTCAARLCSSSHRPHVYPRVPSLLPLQPPYSCTSQVLSIQAHQACTWQAPSTDNTASQTC